MLHQHQQNATLTSFFPSKMHYLLIILTYYVRPLVKWFLRKTTGLCELQRICYGEQHGALRTHAVEGSLRLSRTHELKCIVKWIEDIGTENEYRFRCAEDFAITSTNMILRAKKINGRVHLPFVRSIKDCIEQIWGYYKLLDEVETLRKTGYDSADAEHERKLCRLWDELRPEEPLEGRVTKQWQDIGFQGDDPKTDFRGMGLLGLENLLYFVTKHKDVSSHVYSHSQHPVHGYTFAIVGINLTSIAWNFMKSGIAKTYFYNSFKEVDGLGNFHQFYSVLFYEFDKFWVDSKPENIMAFPVIREKFERDIAVRLRDPQEVFEVTTPIINL